MGRTHYDVGRTHYDVNVCIMTWDVCIMTYVVNNISKLMSTQAFINIEMSNNAVRNLTKMSFKIIHRANTDYELAIKEGMYIDWLKPFLNTQKHVILILLFD